MAERESKNTASFFFFFFSDQPVQSGLSTFLHNWRQTEKRYAYEILTFNGIKLIVKAIPIFVHNDIKE